MSQFLFLSWFICVALGIPGVWSCQVNQKVSQPGASEQATVLPGAWHTGAYFPKIQGKSFGIVCNHTATIGAVHLVDTLIRAGLRPTRLFAPEHGFRGDMPDGHHLGNKKDEITGLEIISIYGENKKPQMQDLEGLDVMLFDIQDVGARFYTYLSTLHYVLEACAEAGIPVILLDRPNPNGHYVDGPVLEKGFTSFVGMHPVPVVYGMTIGEYGQMINGEGWLANHVKAELEVVPLRNYNRQQPYFLPDRPSPNLPNMRSVWLYPSLCFLEGTPLSLGRGTDHPFQLIGHPDLQQGDTYFMPVTRSESLHPPLKNKECRGFDLTTIDPMEIFKQRKMDISWLLKAYQAFPDKESFFLSSGFFDKLAGTNKLRTQLKQGTSEKEIRASWQQNHQEFKKRRHPYLIYPDFE